MSRENKNRLASGTPGAPQRSRCIPFPDRQSGKGAPGARTGTTQFPKTVQRRGVITERRRYRRFASKRGAFGLIIAAGTLPLAGKITDISLGGIGFNYIASAELMDREWNLQLFGSNGHILCLERIECRVVHSSKVINESWGDLISWHCGIRFRNVSGDFLVSLQRFISRFAVFPISVPGFPADPS